MTKTCEDCEKPFKDEADRHIEKRVGEDKFFCSKCFLKKIYSE